MIKSIKVQRSALVTGASSGLGKAISQRLASAGIKVYAGVRSHMDQKSLENLHPNIQAIILDITNESHIQKTFNLLNLTTGKNGLSILVNNAGINYISPFEYSDNQKETQVMQVNLIAMFKLTRTMLPLMHRFTKRSGNHANILNIGSIGSIFSLPWSAAYHASKFAVLGWSESLRAELKPIKIFVSCFLPGGMSTAIFKKSQKEINFDFSGPHRHYYLHNLRHAANTMKKFENSSASPQNAAKKILKAIERSNPPGKIYFGSDARFIRIMCWLGLSSLLKKLFVVNRFNDDSPKEH